MPPEGSVGAADSRVYGQVTLRLGGPGVGEPPPWIVKKALAFECPDCRVNVEVRWEDRGDPEDLWDFSGEWSLLIAHDEPCPWLARQEREG